MRGNKTQAALIILDGWGIGPPWGGNAITQAKTPNMDKWWRSFPHASLAASGEAVGLPAATGGNSETGHLNIGAGRVVPQDLPFINSKIADKSFFSNPKILAAFEHVKKNDSNLHLVGLASLGHVHSDLSHLFALLDMAKANGIEKICLDLFTDGRDSDPNSGINVFEQIENKLHQLGVGKISSVCGRFFAMDRDKNWGRTSRTYNVITKGEAEVGPSAREVISKSYLHSIGDEHIEPHLIAKNGEGKTLISDNDGIIFFNYRPDRARQISKALCSEPIADMPDRKILSNVYFVTFVTREPNPIGQVAFEPEAIKNSLAEVMSDFGLKQFHIAETEKYAHVTYFINGGREKPFPGEHQVMIPSPKVRTYDFTPGMSADKVTSKFISELGHKYDLFICNYANADMVGHAGNFYAAVQAVEYVDLCLGKLVDSLLKYNYTVFITADHGNSEEMINPRTNQPQTEHTSNPVPFVMVSKQIEIAKMRLLTGGALANIAPTILEIMGVPKPEQMTAQSLIWRQNGQ